MANPETLLLWALGIGLAIAAADALWRWAQSYEGRHNVQFLRESGHKDAADALEMHVLSRKEVGRLS